MLKEKIENKALKEKIEDICKDKYYKIKFLDTLSNEDIINAKKLPTLSYQFNIYDDKEVIFGFLAKEIELIFDSELQSLLSNSKINHNVITREIFNYEANRIMLSLFVGFNCSNLIITTNTKMYIEKHNPFFFEAFNKVFKKIYIIESDEFLFVVCKEIIDIILSENFIQENKNLFERKVKIDLGYYKFYKDRVCMCIK